jgi:hypothetical protein
MNKVTKEMSFVRDGRLAARFAASSSGPGPSRTFRFPTKGTMKKSIKTPALAGICLAAALCAGGCGTTSNLAGLGVSVNVAQKGVAAGLTVNAGTNAVTVGASYSQGTNSISGSTTIPTN